MKMPTDREGDARCAALSKRSPDERKRHPGFPLDPHIAALMRATSFAYAASTALLTACGSAIERKKVLG
jgi:hypothetical protein